MCYLWQNGVSLNQVMTENSGLSSLQLHPSLQPLGFSCSEDTPSPLHHGRGKVCENGGNWNLAIKDLL